MGAIVNAPTTPNAGGFELRVTPHRVQASSTRGGETNAAMAAHARGPVQPGAGDALI
jgi:hypothetical protein